MQAGSQSIASPTRGLCVLHRVSCRHRGMPYAAALAYIRKDRPVGSPTAAFMVHLLQASHS